MLVHYANRIDDIGAPDDAPCNLTIARRFSVINSELSNIQALVANRLFLMSYWRRLIQKNARLAAVWSSINAAPQLTARLIRSGITSVIACTIANYSVASVSTQLPADLVVMDAKIYQADANHSSAESLAVRDGKIVYVGPGNEVEKFIGPNTSVHRLSGHLVLPGLFDSHLHPISMIHVNGCDLNNKPRSLNELTASVRNCLSRHPALAGEWFNVHQWNPINGNEPSPDAPTLVAALNRVSTQIPIQLIGSDGHHGAFNSVALGRAKNSEGTAIGFSKATIAREFAAYRKLIGVDASGNPNGAVNEDAKGLMGAPSILLADFDQAIKERAQLPQLLNAQGITGILDALVPPRLLVLYDLLQQESRLTFRTAIAQFYDPEQYRNREGAVDYEAMLASATSIREKYADNPLVRADFVKLHADGVLEGNPYAVPPTLPNTLSIHPYLQPIFSRDKSGHLTVSGYVDTASPLCVNARNDSKKYDDPAQVTRFIATHGFHPGQCTISSGQLRHSRDVIMEFVRRFHAAGFALHIHVIDDGSLAVALDALEAARAADGPTLHDGLAHVQLARPSDVMRIGRDKLYVAFTYSWANADLAYDMAVVPFIDKVLGNNFAALHSPNGYYESNVYPFNAVKAAGGTLVAGSDAPVESRDPRPFVNMSMAVTRHLPNQLPQNPSQAISIREVIDAYTINGARFINRDAESGSIEVNKSADFVELDRDILSLADNGTAENVRETKVLRTWFQGNLVYQRQAPFHVP